MESLDTNYENYIEPDFSMFETKTIKKPKIVAYCSSDACRDTYYKDYVPFAGGVIKNVPRGTDQCPHCNIYLFWDKEITKEKIA